MTSVSTPPNNMTNVCVSDVSSNFLVILIFPVLQILINVFVIIAVLQSRRTLRHNFVYLYVINLLMANVLFGISSGWQYIAYYSNVESIEGHPEPDMLYPNNRVIKNWWAFRSGFTSSLYLIMSGSLSALIHGIRESSYFVGKSSIHFSKRSQRLSSSSSLRNNSSTLFQMLAIVFLVWFLPILLTIAATAGWNCVEHCFCTYGNYGYDVYFCHADVLRHCSRFYQPHRNDFLAVVIACWFIQSLGIVYMNWTTLKKYVKVKTRSERSKFQSRGPALTFDGMDKIEETSDDVFQTPIRSKRFPPLNRNMKLLLILSALFILSTLPIMVISLVDVVSPSYILSHVTTTLAFMLVLIYCSVCPILLVYYMAGLRDAMKRVFYRYCTTTVTTRHSSSVSGERSDAS